MITIRRYTNLKELDDRQRVWSFQRAPDSARPQLADLSCIELRLERLRENSSQHGSDALKEEASRRMDEIIWAFVKAGPGQAYAIGLSYLAPKNRVRSYKGIFPVGGEIRKTDFHHAEVEKGKESFFLGVAKICERNKSESLSFVRSPSRSFILISKLKSAKAVCQNLEKTSTKWLHFQRRSVVTTWKLIPEAVHRDQMVIRFNRDFTGEDWLSLMLFVHTSFMEECVCKLKLIEKRDA